MNAYCMRLRYHKNAYIYIYIIEWKIVEVPKKKYKMIFNTSNIIDTNYFTIFL